MYLLMFAVAAYSVFTEARVLKNDSDARIVGGESASIEEIPYQLSFKTNGRHFCGASIINELHALTAGHCCNAYSWIGLEVTSGSADRDEGQPHPVTGIFVHPKYNKYQIDYDVCVLKVGSAFQWGPATQPVKLAPLGVEPADFERVVVSGWGTVSEQGPDSKQLLQVTIRVIPYEICNAEYALHLTPRMICAGEIGGGKDSCQGDSGGPLHEILSGRQVGIVSWGFGCAEPGYPGVYTDVANPEVNTFIRFISHI